MLLLLIIISKLLEPNESFKKQHLVHNNLQIIINYSSPRTSSNMIVYQSYVISLNTKMDTVYQSSAVVLYGKVCL